MKQLAIIAAVLLAAAPAFADDGAAILGNAQQAIDDIDYATARKLTEQALASGTLEAADVARAHLLAGEVAAALGDADAAHDHFEKALLLAPDAQLPGGLSPKITQPFATAQTDVKQLGSARFDVSLERGNGKVIVTLAGDPLHMAARMRVRMNGGSELDGSAPRLELPADDKLAITATITVLDDHGNQLARRDGGAAVAIESSADTPHRYRTEHSLPAVVRWPTWAAITVIAGGTCGYFSSRVHKDQQDLDSLNASSPMHTYDEAKAIDDRGKRDAMLVNVTLGVAAVAAAAAITTYIIDEHEVEVQPIAAPGTVGAAASVRF